MSSKPPNYYSYILRCWVETAPDDGKVATCRYGLEDPHTGERFTFPGLEPLADFLRAHEAVCGEGGVGPKVDS